MWFTCPISWPIAKILDIWLGEHKIQRYDNTQLQKLVKLHSVQALRNVDLHHLPTGVEGLSIDQAKMIEGALTFQQEKCEEIMTKITKVDFTITLDTVMDSEKLKQINRNGYSRIPVVSNEKDEGHLIFAFLLAKSLVGLDTSERKTLGQLYKEKAVQVKVPLYLSKTCTLGRMIKSFQQGHSHMAIICETLDGATELHDRATDIINNLVQNDSLSEQSHEMSFLDLNREVLGVVTLEDIIERIMMAEIHDERDRDVLSKQMSMKQTITFANTDRKNSE